MIDHFFQKKNTLNTSLFQVKMEKYFIDQIRSFFIEDLHTFHFLRKSLNSDPRILMFMSSIYKSKSSCYVFVNVCLLLIPFLPNSLKLSFLLKWCCKGPIIVDINLFSLLFRFPLRNEILPSDYCESSRLDCSNLEHWNVFAITTCPFNLSLLNHSYSVNLQVSYCIV